MRKVTIQQVRDSFSGVQTGNVVLRKVFRPLSFVATPALMRVGATPNAVTLLGLVAGLMACGLFLNGADEAVIIGTALYFTSIVLDFVDGNIARLVAGATYFGKFLDSTADRIIGVLIPITLSLGPLGVTQHYELGTFLVGASIIPVLTALTCTLWMMQQAVASRYSALASQVAQQRKLNADEAKRGLDSSSRLGSTATLAKSSANFIEQTWEFHMFGVFFFLVPFGYVDIYLTIFCILGVMTSVLRLAHALYLARGTLNVGRTSANQGVYLSSDS